MTFFERGSCVKVAYAHMFDVQYNTVIDAALE